MIISKNEETQEVIEIPESLYECFIALDDMGKKDIEKWLKRPEDQAIAESHHGIGQWIRNNWGLWRGEGKLFNWFKENEVEQPDDMSGIILTAYHRMKNNKELKLQELFDSYVEYYLNETEKLQRKRRIKIKNIDDAI
jgi:hypothetical protein